MRIAIMGSGGVGSYVGGLLAQSGQDVTFIARGAQLEALLSRGLTVQSPTSGNFTCAVRATSDPRTIGDVDLVLMCVKTYDLDTAAEQISSLIGSRTVVLPMQNGIDSAERIAHHVGPDHVLGGVAYVICTLVAPGVVAHKGLNKIVFGEIGGGTSRRTEAVRDLLCQATMTGEMHPDIRIPLWEKFILLAASGGVMAMTRLTIGQIRACTETSALFRGAMEEAASVAQAMGIPLPGDCVDRHWAMASGLDPSARGSMYQDLVTGRRLELESLNGAVVRLGRQTGIGTPLNGVVYAALKPYTEGAPPA